MTRTRSAQAVRFLFYALPFSLFIFGWWECCTRAFVNIWAEQVPGVVTDTKLVTTRGKFGTERDFYIVSFRYTVNGITYTGDRFSCCDSAIKGSGIDTTLRRQNNDLQRSTLKPVAVWVNPAMPEHAVLNRDIPNAAIGMFIFTLLMSFAVPSIVIYRLEMGVWPK